MIHSNSKEDIVGDPTLCLVPNVSLLQTVPCFACTLQHQVVPVGKPSGVFMKQCLTGLSCDRKTTSSSVQLVS